MTALALSPPRPWARAPRIDSARHAEGSEQLSAIEVDEAHLLDALRGGDETAFAEIVRRYHGPLKGFARRFGASDAVAEEIVQEAWLGALKGIDSFEGRSSLKGWLFGIVKNQARRRSERERRSVPFSALSGGEDEGAEPVVDSARFQGADGTWPDHWASAPRAWDDPERRLASLEVRGELRSALAGLPERQRAVVVLRDVEGLGPDEVCDLLELSEGNQRVLLHRGRAAVRDALEGYMDA